MENLKQNMFKVNNTWSYLKGGSNPDKEKYLFKLQDTIKKEFLKDMGRVKSYNFDDNDNTKVNFKCKDFTIEVQYHFINHMNRGSWFKLIDIIKILNK